MTTENSKFSGLKSIEKLRGQMTFGRLLLSFRLSQNLSQLQLGKKVGLSKANICDLEKGRSMPTIARAKKIAKALCEIEAYWVEVAIQDMLKRERLNYTVKIEENKTAS